MMQVNKQQGHANIMITCKLSIYPVNELPWQPQPIIHSALTPAASAVANS
jgi:hypothetical protein